MHCRNWLEQLLRLVLRAHNKALFGLHASCIRVGTGHTGYDHRLAGASIWLGRIPFGYCSTNRLDMMLHVLP